MASRDEMAEAALALDGVQSILKMGMTGDEEITPDLCALMRAGVLRAIWVVAPAIAGSRTGAPIGRPSPLTSRRRTKKRPRSHHSSRHAPRPISTCHLRTTLPASQRPHSAASEHDVTS